MQTTVSNFELIDMIPGDTVGLATQGNFYDLCKGGHIASTGMLKHVKLTAIWCILAGK